MPTAVARQRRTREAGQRQNGKEKRHRRHMTREDYHFNRKTHKLHERVERLTPGFLTIVKARWRCGSRRNLCPSTAAAATAPRNCVVCAMGCLSVEDVDWTARGAYQCGLGEAAGVTEKGG